MICLRSVEQAAVDGELQKIPIALNGRIWFAQHLVQTIMIAHRSQDLLKFNYKSGLSASARAHDLNDAALFLRSGFAHRTVEQIQDSGVSNSYAFAELYTDGRGKYGLRIEGERISLPDDRPFVLPNIPIIVGDADTQVIFSAQILRIALAILENTAVQSIEAVLESQDHTWEFYSIFQSEDLQRFELKFHSRNHEMGKCLSVRA